MDAFFATVAHDTNILAMVVMLILCGVVGAIIISVTSMRWQLDGVPAWKVLLSALTVVAIGIVAFVQGQNNLWPIPSDYNFLLPPDGTTIAMGWALLSGGVLCVVVASSFAFYSGWYVYHDVRRALW